MSMSLRATMQSVGSDGDDDGNDNGTDGLSSGECYMCFCVQAIKLIYSHHNIYMFIYIQHVDAKMTARIMS